MAYPYPPAPKKSNKTWLIVAASVLGLCLICGGIAAGTGAMAWIFSDQTAPVADNPQPTPTKQIAIQEATQPPVKKTSVPTATQEVVIPPEQPTEAPLSPTSASLVEGNYAEDFSTRNGDWPETETDTYKVGYTHVQSYSISLLAPSRMAYVVPPYQLQPPFANVIVNVSLRPGAQDGGYGILCGFQDIQNYYEVKISGTQYAIFKVVQDQITFLTEPDWKPAVDIDKLDNNGNVNVGVSCMGGTIVLQINNFGQTIVTDEANSFPTGDVAIFASSGTTQGSEGYNTVFFDDFSLQVNKK
jgi:hypothetical protein